MEYLAMIKPEYVTTFLLAVFIYMVGFSLWKSHRSSDIRFNLLDLLMKDGRVSKVSVIVMTAFTLHSWAIVTWILNKTVSDQAMLTYAGIWVTPLLARLVFGSHNGDSNDLMRPTDTK